MARTAWPVLFMEQLIYGSSEKGIGIVVLWTRKEIASKKISQQNYTVMGQLYSKHQGINALIVNCLANKNIRYLIITGLDLSGSGETLIKLFARGVNEKRMLNGEDNFVLDENITLEEFESFRKNVQLLDLRQVQDFNELNPTIEKLEKRNSYGENKIFNLTIPKPPEIFPSLLTGLQVVAPSIPRAWPLILDKIMQFGTLKESEYGEKQKELLCFTSIITDDSATDWNRFFPFTREEMLAYVPQVTTALDIEGVEYTYGQRLRKPIDQIAYLVEKLKTAPHSRRLVACTWKTEHDYNNTNSPCLVLVQLNVVEDKLFLTAFFRSNDMFAAWPKNAFALREMQKNLAQECKLMLGHLTIISQSAHIYEHDFAKAKETIQSTKPRFDWTPDPNGNFIITTREGEIFVTHVNQGSKMLEEFHGKTALEIYRFIASKNKISVISHALDVGCELQKAEIAIRLGITYTQDKELPLIQLHQTRSAPD